MATAEEVRGLIESSDELWETLSVDGRAWQDRLVGREAVAARHANPRGPRVNRSERAAARVGDQVLGQREQTWHLWRGGRILVRSEYTIGKELITVVGQGPRWWRWSPVLGATSGGSVGRPVRLVLGPPGALLDGARLIEHIEFTGVSSTTVAGRPAHLVRGVPNADRPRGRLALREAGPGADEYEIAVDAERGVLLSITALRGKQPFQTVEATTISYDAVLAPTLFAPERSSGERFVEAHAPQHMTVEQLAEVADFTVLIPEPSPSPSPPYVALFESDRRGLGPRHAVLMYVVVDPDLGRGQLRITMSARELPRTGHDEWRSLGSMEVSEERHGRVLRRRIRAQREGTHIELESALLPPPRMVEVLDSLVPVRTA